jgi:hypothetical protein
MQILRPYHRIKVRNLVYLALVCHKLCMMIDLATFKRLRLRSKMTVFTHSRFLGPMSIAVKIWIWYGSDPAGKSYRSLVWHGVVNLRRSWSTGLRAANCDVRTKA